ncbi:MAG: hypothetical protein HY864_06960 [Chloroflexi bacterium]|nr:hypothetical protein [Chloroflexota bacterium]
MNKLQQFFSKKGAGHKHAAAFAAIRKRVENRNWPDMIAGWIMDEKDPKPELWLLCDFVSMAESLAQYHPVSADAFLVHPPEVVEFKDGSGAVVFELQDGSEILQLTKFIFQTEYDQKILVIAGAAKCLPVEDETTLMKMFNPKEKFSIMLDTLVWTM